MSLLCDSTFSPLVCHSGQKSSVWDSRRSRSDPIGGKNDRDPSHRYACVRTCVCRHTTVVGHHVIGDNVTGGHVKVMQVGSVDSGQFQHQVFFPLAKNSKSHVLSDSVLSNFLKKKKK